MKRIRKSGWLLAALIAGVGLTAAFWPHGPALELYTTPPLKLKHRTVRLQVMAPAGWRADSPRSLAPGDDAVEVTLKPAPRMAWLPEWLRRRLVGGPEPNAWLMLCADGGGVDGGADPHIQFLSGSVVGKGEYRQAVRSYQRGAKFSAIAYGRSDQKALQASYQQVCASFQVLR